MKDLSDEQRRAELGEFFRSHRERLTPDMFGMDFGTRRRTPGLRREEVAQLAGVSATWYTWIEQGRDLSVSPAALSRLAQIMRLTAAERGYLFELAGKRDPETPPDLPPGDLGRELGPVVAAIATPAYVLDRAWNTLAWNEAATKLFVGWLDGESERNLLAYVFLNPVARTLIADWETRASRLAAEFRADYSRHLAAPDTREVVERLREQSPFFDRAWQAHAVTDREGGERTFNHPADGFLRYEQTTFLLARHQEVKLVVLTRA
ncbi:MAG TPA: helix-turn-helix transcriptional regulator [Devosiaceae bacterium]|nr:helix-turn-helix transcriptional regulator [Devosiaceae bacterium]